VSPEPQEQDQHKEDGGVPAGGEVPTFSALSWQALPLFGTFFLWGLGTGAQQLARPLFASSFGVPIFLITLITASNAMAHLISAPITGFLTDRWGRKPLVIFGNLLRGVTTALQFFSRSYFQFFILEFIGGIGVSMWGTGSSIIMADVTRPENRGRAMAVRGTAMRLGSIIGPAVGGLIASFSSLRYIFLFNAVTKIGIHLLLVLMVRETRPESTRLQASPGAKGGTKLDASMFLRRPVLVVALVTFAMAAMGQQGAYGALFPVYAKDSVGLTTGDVGSMMSLAATVGLIVALPNGFLMDRFGRKRFLIPGLLILSISAYLLSQITTFQAVIITVMVFGAGQGMSMGGSEVVAIDLAPEDRRGAFLGIWTLFRNIGAIVGPLLVGLIAEFYGFPTAFISIGVFLVFCALMMAVFGPETGGKWQPRTQRPAS
jgi:MFS family permease